MRNILSNIFICATEQDVFISICRSYNLLNQFLRTNYKYSSFSFFLAVSPVLINDLKKQLSTSLRNAPFSRSIDYQHQEIPYMKY